MKELKLYQCEICGTQYSDKLKAEECEKHHATGLEVVNGIYLNMKECADKFPVKIWVKSKDGEERMYVR